MTNRPPAPCRKCADRWVADGKTCHSTCEKYQEYRSHLYDTYQDRERAFAINDYELTRKQKITKRINLTKRW